MTLELSRPDTVATESLPPGERAHNLADQLHEPSYMRALRDALSPSEEEVRQLSGSYLRAAEALSRSIDDPDIVDALRRVARHLELEDSATELESVPDGLIAVMKEDSRQEPYLRLEPDPRLPYGNKESYEVLRRKINDSAYTEFSSISKERQEEVVDIIVKTWHSSPLYSFLVSFDNSQRTPEKAGIDPYWRAIREKQIEDSIRKKYGLGAESLLPGSNARTELVRELYRLDDEENFSQQEAQPAHGLKSLQAFLRPYIEKAYIAMTDYTGDAPLTIVKIDQNDAVVHFNDGKSCDIIELSYHVVELLYEHTGGGLEEYGMTYYRAREAIYAVLLRNRGSVKDALDEADYEEMYVDLDGISDGFFTYVVAELHETGLAYNDTYILPVQETYDENSFKLQDTVNSERYPASNITDIFNDYASIVPRSQQESLARQTIAYVDSYYDTNARLVSPNRKPLVHLSKPIAYDISLRLAGEASTAVSIPGYTYLGSYEDKLLYSKERADPYAPCNVPIPADTLTSLINYYEKGGLASLADRLRHISNPCVADLVAALREESTYAYDSRDQQGNKVSLEKASVNEFYSLKYIEDSVYDGKLEVQCTGAAQVLRLSLNHLFGEGAASPRFGHVLRSRSDHISRLGHAQVAFAHEGSLYLLDSTPGTTRHHSESFWDQLRSFARAALSPSANPPQLDTLRSQRTNDQGDADIQSVLAPGKPIERRKAEKVDASAISAEVFKNILTLAMANYATRTEEAPYKAIVAVPESDPLRKTIRFVKRLIRDQTYDADEAKVLRNYLQLVIDSPKSKKALVHADQYDPSVLNQCIGALDRLETAYAD